MMFSTGQRYKFVSHMKDGLPVYDEATIVSIFNGVMRLDNGREIQIEIVDLPKGMPDDFITRKRYQGS